MAQPVYPQPEDAATRPVASLRRGWTTGTCATAATTAAVRGLYGLAVPDAVEVRLPRGGIARLRLAESWTGDGAAGAALVKDAGDDPDVTHGCLVRVVAVPAAPGAGVRFRAGEGVGTVTLPGLPIPPGEPAINPVPRRMMRDAVAEVAVEAGRPGDVELTVSIPGGEALAARTLNPRLGIVGGLSILGTTGVVVPFSCASWIHSIHRGIDVARAAGLDHLAAATGSTSEAFVRARYGLPDMAVLDMGDFVGGTLKYLRRHPVPRLSLVGGIGKLAKLAQGALDLHSARSTLDRPRLAAMLAAAGAPAALCAAVDSTVTVAGLLELAEGFPFGDFVCRHALSVASDTVGRHVVVEVLAIDRAGRLVGRADGW
ncbi:MAG: cobalt-precorrin-5B (C(1))-methyltransferase [Geminicoccaceae bacterium]